MFVCIRRGRSSISGSWARSNHEPRRFAGRFYSDLASGRRLNSDLGDVEAPVARYFPHACAGQADANSRQDDGGSLSSSAFVTAFIKQVRLVFEPGHELGKHLSDIHEAREVASVASCIGDQARALVVEIGSEDEVAETAKQLSGLHGGRWLLIRLIRPGADRSRFLTKGGVGIPFEAILRANGAQ